MSLAAPHHLKRDNLKQSDPILKLVDRPLVPFLLSLSYLNDSTFLLCSEAYLCKKQDMYLG